MVQVAVLIQLDKDLTELLAQVMVEAEVAELALMVVVIPVV